MWTHRNPRRSPEHSLEYIQERGRLSLYRAISIRRVVAFVGSGVSMSYGRASWPELVDEATTQALRAYDEYFDFEVYKRKQFKKKRGADKNTARPSIKKAQSHIYAIKELRNQLYSLHKMEGKKIGELVLALGLAESLVEKLGDDYEHCVRDAITYLLSTPRGEAIERSARQNLAARRSILRLLGKSQHSVAVQKRKHNPNPVRSMIRDMGINRFVTLNYDVEIEREFAQIYRTSNYITNEESEFDRLCNYHPKEDFGDGKKHLSKSQSKRKEYVTKKIVDPRFDNRVVFQDGLVKSVASVNLNSNNIGDMVNFSVFGRQFEAQVFHLHGRYDNRGSMVLTEEDYRETYLKEGQTQYTFDEALAALFAGNDVLFVGVGMGETDMMRPLRQFLSRENRTDIVTGHVYNLKERTVSFHLRDFESETRTGKELKEYIFDRYLNYSVSSDYYDKDSKTIKDRVSNGAMLDYVIDSKYSLELFSQYEIATLFYGNREFRLIRIALLFIQEISDQAIKVPRTTISTISKTILQEIESYQKAEKADLLTENDYAVINVILAQSTKYRSLFKLSKGGADEKTRDRLSTYIKQLQNEVRSRALNSALKRYSEKQVDWWEDWKRVPQNRDANYTKTYCFKDKSKSRPLVARHRVDYEQPTLDYTTQESLVSLMAHSEMINKHVDSVWNNCVNDNCSVVDELSENIKKWLPEDKDVRIKLINDTSMRSAQYIPKRIIRVAMDRGSGKGSLMHLLQQEKPDTGVEPGRYYDDLFDGAGSTDNYHGAFFCSLSFSMEFASVLEALHHFIRDAAIGLYINRGIDRGAEEKLKVLSEFEDAEAALMVHKKMLEKSHLIESSKPDMEKSKKLVKVFDDVLSSINGKNRHERTHRLQKLRTITNVYTWLAMVYVNNDYSCRILLAFSGMDQLCDDNGVAYNPMYRAFFRLLSGNGLRYREESNPLSPIDILFVAGNPDKPIWYLSDQYTQSELNSLLSHPGGPYSSEMDYRPQKNNSLYLEKWKRLPPIRMSERLWLNYSKNDIESTIEKQKYTKDMRIEAQNMFAVLLGASKKGVAAPKQAAIVSHGSIARDAKDGAPCRREREAPDFRELRGVLRSGVALHGWCVGVFRERYGANRRVTSISALYENGVRYCKKLNIEAARSGKRGVIDVVIEELRDSTDERLNDILGENMDDIQGRHEVVSTVVKLLEFVLAHLAIFPMPVPYRVLYGCDEIYYSLKELENRLAVARNPPPRALSRTKMRQKRIVYLNNLVSFLGETRLVIKVNPKQENRYYEFYDENSEAYNQWTLFNSRYTVQQQLKEYFAHKMGFTLPDQGERNFYQLSLYCDQPKDLPTPSGRHYSLFKNIIESQIMHCRNTLWCFYQLKYASESPRRISDYNRNIALNGIVRRLDPTYVKKSNIKCKHQLDPSLTSIHAVHQRARAMYGILRSGFSVGALSRLPGYNDDNLPDQPFERHKGWLRGITNVAVGIDHVEEIFEQIVREKKLDLKPLRNRWTDIDVELEVKSGLGVTGERLPTVSKPFYKDEKGWLYNERGVISLAQGNLYDAIPLFRQAQRVMDHDDGDLKKDPALHAAIRRVKLNAAIAQIERGNLTLAREVLESLMIPTDFSHQFESLVSWIGRGYLGLIKHLGGDFAAAKNAYKTATEHANENEMMRLSSIFNRHLCDLERGKENYEEAQEYAKYSVSSALQSEQRDVLWLARLSQAHVWLSHDQNQFNSQIDSTIQGVLKYSSSMGLPRLEVAALQLHARQMHHNGDRVLAGSIASQSAAIATRYGLRIYRLGSLLIYADALVGRQQFDLADKIVKEVRRDAENRGYLNLAGRVSSVLEKIPGAINGDR